MRVIKVSILLEQHRFPCNPTKTSDLSEISAIWNRTFQSLVFGGTFVKKYKGLKSTISK